MENFKSIGPQEIDALKPGSNIYIKANIDSKKYMLQVKVSAM